MENVAVEKSEPIYDLAIDCEKLYAKQISRLKKADKASDVTILSELSQRFATWTAFLGVFAESKICLDRRLRHHVEIQEQVLRLLDVVERNLRFGTVFTVWPFDIKS
jgi:dynamin-binding protein